MTATDPDTSPHGPEVVAAPIVDWRRTARRLRRQLLVIAGLVVAAWLVIGLAGAGLSVRLLAEVTGFGFFLAFVAEVVVVGGSAVRGMLIAGERGERRARADVTLLPPQLRRGGGCP
ncbi:MAG TPA: hypothetical protein VK906_15640 [Egicoccus sp.]|nr:hypothetical protein [Egicoccus sp.]HSK24618.1 hypothetical protein [Egicoccus sp.]